MKCSTCFRDAKADPCERCATLTEEERKLVRESLRPAVRAIRLIDAAFKFAFETKPHSPR